TMTVKLKSGDVPLLAGHRYQVRLISTQATDAQGNSLSYETEEATFTFATQGAATQGASGTAVYPTIVSTSPADGAVNVSTEILNTTGVSLTFSMLMDQASVKNSQFELVDVTDSSNNLAFDLNSSFVDVDFSGTSQTKVTVKFATGNGFSLDDDQQYQVRLKSTGAHKLDDASKKQTKRRAIIQQIQNNVNTLPQTNSK
ncbi:TPA: hypothetical protein EYO57_30290, partial [Candidatus Poribacteria bacterium]|nr:hypothetical protein [Candidatus Poribacteria bacterium]